MSLLYVNDSGATIGIEGNCCTVKQKDGSKLSLIHIYMVLNYLYACIHCTAIM